MASDTIQNICEDDLEQYNINNNVINEWLLTENFISKFNENSRNIINEYSIGPMTATFEQSNKNLKSIDFNKAYTSCLYDMEYIPVFNVFDEFIDYDQHVIEDYTYYLTEFNNNDIDTKNLIGKKHALFLGIY